MLKLIKLEWKKNNIGKYVRNAVILAGLLCLFIFALAYLGIANDPDTGVPDAAPGNEMISSSIELFTSMSFLIFTSVMLASFIVTAYKNRTMNLMRRTVSCTCRRHCEGQNMEAGRKPSCWHSISSG